MRIYSTLFAVFSKHVTYTISCYHISHNHFQGLWHICLYSPAISEIILWYILHSFRYNTFLRYLQSENAYIPILLFSGTLYVFPAFLAWIAQKLITLKQHTVYRCIFIISFLYYYLFKITAITEYSVIPDVFNFFNRL